MSACAGRAIPRDQDEWNANLRQKHLLLADWFFTLRPARSIRWSGQWPSLTFSHSWSNNESTLDS